MSDDQDKTRIQPPRKGPPRKPVRPPASDHPTLPSAAETEIGDEVKTLATDDPALSASMASRARAHNTGLAPQDILKNRFILEKVLGAGGMGVVYRAKDMLKVEAQDRDPYVAIKVLGEDFKSHPEAFIALQRECRKTQRIAHPNIVNVHDFDKDGDTVFMTMEYLEGSPLDKLIKKYRATGLPRPDVWRILEGFCSALAYAHQQNIIHSDLKPGNIYVTKKMVAKVFDFGIARAVAKAEQGEPESEDKTVFDAGNLGALTPTYASLEMLEGDPPDVRDDIYALGCIAYELFTGQHPYKRKNAREALRRGMKPKRIEGLSKKQWRVIESALALQREDRIGSVREFWTSLTRKHTRPYAIWASFLLTAVVAGAGLWSTYLQPEPPPPPQLSEDDFRSEIETRIRLELVQSNIANLLELASFDERWERSLREEVQLAHQLLGPESEEAQALNQRIFGLYREQIEEEVEADQFELARRHVNNAEFYSEDDSDLASLNALIEERIAALEAQRLAQLEQQRAAEQSRRQQAQSQQTARRQAAFAAELAKVEEQLACNTVPNMDQLSQSVQQMRELDSEAYQAEETRFIQSLGECISTLARNFPDRARAAQTAALALFDDHQTLKDISIGTPDPCRTALAGLGARGQRSRCQDSLASGGRGPTLVVIPAQQGMDLFAIGRYEVSVAEFNQFCSASPACEPRTSGNSGLPITGIPLSLVQQYLHWLNEQTERSYRLPTQAEWRYAARAQGRSLDSNRNCTLNSRGIQKGGSLLNASIGQQNGWGLVNYVGNAAEWATGGNGVLVMGGSYDTPMEDCTIDYARSHDGRADPEAGFRVARGINP